MNQVPFLTMRYPQRLHSRVRSTCRSSDDNVTAFLLEKRGRALSKCLGTPAKLGGLRTSFTPSIKAWHEPHSCERRGHPFRSPSSAQKANARSAHSTPAHKSLKQPVSPGRRANGMSWFGVMAVTAPRETLCLVWNSNGPGGQEFPRCLIINGHMSCGSRFPPKRKRSFLTLAVMPTLKLAGAPEKQAMIPLRGTGP
jgi:hypothetical protein